MSQFIGIDFGTTNSVLSVCDQNGETRTAHFDWPQGSSQTFRSILCFWQENLRLHQASGQIAIDEYLKDTEESRLIQSIKTYLGSSLFTETRIFNTRFELEDLIAILIRDLWDKAALQLNLDPNPNLYTVVVGRPVEFSGSNPDDNLASTRLLESYKRAGFDKVTFAFEPEGAAFWFAHQNQTKSRILVADFGGGTSDFSIVEIDGDHIKPIAHAGVGLAGDMLDFRLIDHVVAPALGKGSQYKSFNKWLDMPISYYRSFSSWHLLSMLKTPKTLRDLRDIMRTSNDPDAIDRLAIMIEQEMGYLLYGAIAQTKTKLSLDDSADFHFQAGSIDIQKRIRRDDFEDWIAGDITMIQKTIEKLMFDHHLNPDQIDRVFMTGGTSFVPAIRHLIGTIFGMEKIANGHEFTSVSAGLALIAYNRQNCQ